jgi:pyrrolidone-carboxylate peptidase
MVLSHHWHAVRNLECLIGFAHLPLTLEQSIASGRELPGLPIKDLARAIECMLTVLRSQPIEKSPSLLT